VATKGIWQRKERKREELTVRNWFSKKTLQNQSLPFTHYIKANALFKIAPDDAEELLQKAEELTVRNCFLKNIYHSRTTRQQTHCSR